VTIAAGTGVVRRRTSVAAVRGRFMPWILNSYLCNGGVRSLLVTLIDFDLCHNFGRDFFLISSTRTRLSFCCRSSFAMFISKLFGLGALNRLLLKKLHLMILRLHVLWNERQLNHRGMNMRLTVLWNKPWRNQRRTNCGRLRNFFSTEEEEFHLGELEKEWWCRVLRELQKGWCWCYLQLQERERDWHDHARFAPHNMYLADDMDYGPIRNSYN